MRFFLNFLILFLACVVGGAASAEVTSIRCPLPNATQSITDHLPPGWWTTPVANRLTGTRVQDIGGKTALMCLYGDSGAIQRYAPLGQNCRALRDGFRCTGRRTSSPGTIPAPTRVVAAAGTLTVRQTYKFDLDRGREQNQGADFWFEAERRTRLFLTPQNDARIAVGDRSARGYDGCARARYSQSRVPLKSLPVGSYICAKTNEGRISQFRILEIAPGHPTTLRIRFTTWR